MPDCKCVPVAVALRLALDGREIPTCPEHDEPDHEAGTPLALNDSDGLTHVIASAFSAPVTTATEL